jgi:hypothetical protein
MTLGSPRERSRSSTPKPSVYTCTREQAPPRHRTVRQQLPQPRRAREMCRPTTMSTCAATSCSNAHLAPPPGQAVSPGDPCSSLLTATTQSQSTRLPHCRKQSARSCRLGRAYAHDAGTHRGGQVPAPQRSGHECLGFSRAVRSMASALGPNVAHARETAQIARNRPEPMRMRARKEVGPRAMNTGPVARQPERRCDATSNNPLDARGGA